MSEELRRNIRELKEMLTLVSERLRTIESKIDADERSRPAPAAAAAPPPPAPAAVVKPAQPVVQSTAQRAEHCRVHPERVVQWSCATCHTPLCVFCGGVAFQGRVRCKRCETASKTEPAARRAPQARETLETRIGRDWLNRIGIVSLVLGVAFFILYSFQYLGPAAKLAIGAAVAGGLLGAGVWLERRAPFRWVARGLIGGGWALLYFTTYAMHHIQAVRVLDSALADLALLALVAAGAVGHSLKYRSQTITSLALLLGFLTIFVSNVTYFTLVSSALLVIALVWLVVRMQWDGLYLYGVITSYATHLFWVNKQIALSPILAVHVANAAQAQFWLNVSFVSLYWVVYNVALFALNEQDRTRRNRLLTATLINSWLFVYLVLTAMGSVFRESRYLVLLGVGIVYWLSDVAARRRQLPTIATVHLLLGLVFITLAIPLKFTGRWLSFLWTMEVALLVWVGLRYARWPYRWFAMVWAAVIFVRLLFLDVWNAQTILVWQWMMPWRVLIGCFGITSFGLAAWWYRQPQFAPVLRPAEAPAFHLYFTAAAALAWILTSLEVEARWVPVALALEAAGSVLLGFRLKDRFIRVLGAAGLGLVGLQLLSSVGTWDTWAVALIVGLLYGMSWCYRSALGQGAGVGLRPQQAYAVAASVLLTMLLHAKIHSAWLSVAWAAEGLALVAAGFTLREKTLRVSGLGVFGLLVLKILFHDLAGAETIYRILSFIAAGALLLVASLVYAKYAGRAPTSGE